MRPISIWQPRSRDGVVEFVRPPAGPWPDHNAVREVIPARTTQRRLCWLGESAAAGYLLAPDWTPANALQERLGPGWDVVDLARTNERIDSLIATAEAAMQLDPEVLVIHAGNNWDLLETPTWTPSAGSRAFADALASGVAGPIQAAADELSAKVEVGFARLAELGCRVIIVIPAVNLAWPTGQPVHLLPGDGVSRWYASWSDPAAMLGLDGGLCPTAFSLLAERDPEGSTAARAAVDTTRFPTLGTLAAPRAGASVQELLRRQAARHSFEVVDLDAIFGDLPGWADFYDYCHHTPAGIDRAMDAVAAQLGGDRGTSRLPARVLARAALGAAVHGAHRGLRGAPVQHWVEESLRHDPSGALLHHLVALRAKDVPAELVHNHGLSLQDGVRWPGLDAEVLTAIEAALGPEALAPLDRPRLVPWSRLDQPFMDAAPSVGVPRHVAWRILWPTVDLALVATEPVEIEVTLRAPGQVTLTCDEKRLATWSLGSDWHRCKAHLTPRNRLTRLTLHFPVVDHPDEPFQPVIQRLREGRPALLHPVFGEVLTLRVGDSVWPPSPPRLD